MLYIILIIEPCTIFKTNSIKSNPFKPNHIYIASLTTVFNGYSCIANLIRLSLGPRFFLVLHTIKAEHNYMLSLNNHTHYI